METPQSGLPYEAGSKRIDYEESAQNVRRSQVRTRLIRQWPKQGSRK